MKPVVINMTIFVTWLKYVWPFWLVQFLVLFISSGPSNIWLWLGFVVFFNSAAFLMAWDSVRMKRRLQQELDLLEEALKKYEEETKG